MYFDFIKVVIDWFYDFVQFFPSYCSVGKNGISSPKYTFCIIPSVIKINICVVRPDIEHIYKNRNKKIKTNNIFEGTSYIREIWMLTLMSVHTKIFIIKESLVMQYTSTSNILLSNQVVDIVRKTYIYKYLPTYDTIHSAIKQWIERPIERSLIQPSHT